MMQKLNLALWLIFLTFFLPFGAVASEGGGAAHADPFASVLIILFSIIMAAMVGRWASIRLRQPAVLGELLIGVLIGNVGYFLGEPLFVLVMNLESVSNLFSTMWHEGLAMPAAAQMVFSEADLAMGGVGERIMNILAADGATKYGVMVFGLWLCSNLGVILLLFMVGLETTVSDMMKVGFRALMVAIIGVVLPFGLGFFTSLFLLPEMSMAVHLFLGATLCATSVGITARVLKDLQKIHSPEAKIILGAAVIDDVLGLIILAVVAGVVTTGEMNVKDISWIFLSCIGFLAVVMFFGERLLQWLMPMMARMDRQHSKLLLPLAAACVLAWMANAIGLATIVGAFAAGLILKDVQFAKYFSEDGKKIHELVAPLEVLFAPIFFVLMGMQVDLSTFSDPTTVSLAAAFTVVAIVGKLACGLPAGKGVDRWSIGIGMIPRGEVGLIFASVGKSLGVVSGSVFAAIVIMVILTTLVTPFALKWSLFRQKTATQ